MPMRLSEKGTLVMSRIRIEQHRIGRVQAFIVGDIDDHKSHIYHQRYQFISLVIT